MARVGSEYRKPDRDRVRWALRQNLLRRTEELAPEVLKNLRDTVLPTCRAAATPGAVPQGLLLWKWNRQEWDRVDPTVHGHVAALRAALLAWGERYILTDDWLLEVALLTVYRQHEWEQEARDRLQEGLLVKSPPDELDHFAPVPFADITQAPRPFKFEHRAWIPWWQPWEEYEVEVRVEFRRTLKKLLWAHRKARRADARKMGLRLSPSRRQIEGHLEWLILWQVKAWDWERIERESSYKRSRDQIREAVRRMATDLGLTNLRRGKSGPRT